MSIRFRLMLYFLALLLLPILTLGIMGPIFYATSIERLTMDHTIAMIGQVTANIEARVQEMERLIDLIAATPEVHSFFSATGSALDREKDISRILAVVSGTHEDIAGILLVSRDDRWAGEDFYRITRDPLIEESWYKEARDHPSQVRLIARPFGRNVRSTMGYGADEVVSVIKAISNPRGGPILGVVLIDMKLSVIEEVFGGTALGKNGFLFIADSKGELVYAPSNKVIYRVPLASLGGESSTAFVKIGGVDYQVISKRSSYTGWRTLGVFSVSEALREVLAVRYLSLLIGSITAILAVIAAFFFTSSIARPVLSLRSLMKRVEEGDLSVRSSSDSGDEIGELGHGFNEMLGRIQGLIGQVYREQKSKREAELGILQEQIKPHFLYNTLDTIQWMAQEHRVEDVVCMVGALSSLFRIGLNKGRELIDLSDELKHVESYLCIQKMRYEDKFDFAIRGGEGLGGYQVLRLILQPLVENAIYHGIKERRGNGKLLVEVSQAEGELRLLVRDDGVGIDEARLANLNIALESQDFASEGLVRGYGIRNVHERIVLTFGAPYGLRFAAVPGGGTEVRIRHPLLRAEGL
ncbi:MAG TPA: sensor histidine kinase [Rectinemataceae bacterium]|nr:sensor histidine kinase [Rectinemataceae bacterium]